MASSLHRVVKSLAVPRQVLVRALVVVVAGAPVVVAAALVQGTGGAVWAALGTLTGLSSQAFLGPARSAVLSVVSAVLVAAATAAMGHALAVGLLAALAAIAGGLASRLSAGVLSIAPAMAAIAGSAPLKLTWLEAGGWLLAGAFYGIAVLWIARVRVPARPVAIPALIVYTAVLTVLCGVAAGLTVALGLPHGYWIVLTFASVLRPSRDESASRARGRVAGTLLGALVPLPLVALLPAQAMVALAVVSLYLFLCYLLTRQYVTQVVFLTSTTILVASGGLAAAAVTLGEYRVLWTLAGVAAAAALAAVLWYGGRALGISGQSGARSGAEPDTQPEAQPGARRPGTTSPHS